MSNFERYILKCLKDIQIFLATSGCEPYLDSITKVERNLTLDTLLQLEINIKGRENKMWSRKSNPLPISDTVIWQETAEKLAKYYHREGFTYADIMEVLPVAIKTFNRLLYNHKRSDIDYVEIWRETENNLIKYFSKEGYSDTYIHECFAPVIDVFEKLLEEEDE